MRRNETQTETDFMAFLIETGVNIFIETVCVELARLFL